MRVVGLDGHDRDEDEQGERRQEDRAGQRQPLPGHVHETATISPAFSIMKTMMSDQRRAPSRPTKSTM